MEANTPNLEAYYQEVYKRESNRPAMTYQMSEAEMQRLRGIRDQIQDLDDVLPGDMKDQWQQDVNKRGQERRQNRSGQGNTEINLAGEHEAMLRASQGELAEKRALFDQAVQEGRLSPDAIQEMNMLEGGYVKIVTFSGESFSGTRWQVKGLVKGVTGAEEMFSQLLRGERVQRGQIDTNDRAAVERRLQDLNNEADAKKVIRENTTNIDLRNVDVNDPRLPEGLRREAQTPEFQALVRAKDNRELTVVLAKQNPELQAFVQSPDYQRVRRLMEAGKNGGQDVLRIWLQESTELRSAMAQARKTEAQLEKLGRQVSAQLETALRGNEGLRILQQLNNPAEMMRQMRENPQGLQEALALTQEQINGVLAQITEQVQAESQELLTQMRESFAAVNLANLPSNRAARQYTELMSAALNAQIDKWGLMDSMPSSGRLDRSVSNGSDVRFQ